MKVLARSIALVIALPFAAPAQTLTFEKIPIASGNTAPIGNYYDGGAGPNYGIEFSPNALALCLNTLETFCSNVSRGMQGDPTSRFTGLIFIQGSSIMMSRVAGFANPFSFYYATIQEPGAFSAWSGPYGTGSLLVSVILPMSQTGCSPGYRAEYCPLDHVEVHFEGIAQSVTFAGGRDRIAFDDITFISPVPSTVVPEPGTLTLLATGLIGVFGAARRRRQAAQRNAVLC
jgi:hypothetical protein